MGSRFFWLIFPFVFLGIGICSFSQNPKKDYQVFQEGIDQFKVGKYDAVITLFSEILGRTHEPKLDEDLYYYRGQAFFHTREYKSALIDLNQCLFLNHYNKAFIHWYIGKCQEKLDKKELAIKEYTIAADLAKNNKNLLAQIEADRERAKGGQGVSQSVEPGQVPQVKEKATEPVAPQVSRSAGEEKKITQVIVNNKPKDEPAKPVDEPVVQGGKTGLVPSLAEAYKDEKRYALIIGNSTYPSELGILKNPANDATDIAEELRNSNFEVQLLINATYIQIREAVRRFHEKLINGPRDQTVGLFYYAGHGVQYQDENYLVPVDAKIQFEDDIVRMCFPVQRMVLANMERSNSRMNIIILDACRNNPFPVSTRSAGSQGLTEMKKARGSFIAYATAPGSVASDGIGRNGLYTQELLKAIRKNGLSIEQVFKEVRQNVLRLSSDQQYTWDSSNIIGEFYFKY